MRFEDGYELECNQGRTIHSGWDYGAGDGVGVGHRLCIQLQRIGPTREQRLQD